MTIRAIQRALLSVYDKTGLVELGRGLRARGIELLSTGGTAAALRTAELEVVDVSAVTGAPEILDGRVKTLHPAIHGGILARRDLASHLATIAEHSIVPIDLVVANLYPFEATLGSGMGFADCVERIDVGGPAMIRAAAKNHNGVAVLVEPADYDALLTELDTLGGTGLALRRRLAAKAFARTAAYDAAIAGWLAAEAGDALPERLVIAGMRRQSLRYGENPHQRAAFYAVDGKPVGVAAAVQLQGKELSFNNLNDTDAALALVSEFDEPAVVIVKHANACGVGMGEDPLAAYRKALACDPVSAFGGIVACNRALDGATAAEICRTFTEVVVAAGVDAAAAAVFAERPNLRLLRVDELPDPLASGRDLRWLAGGFLVQDRDAMRLPPDQWQIATRRPPDEAELSDLLFAWKVVKHVKSNAIVLARDRATVGIGMGQTSRVDAVDLAARRAARHAGSRPCVLASDAFFPFADGLEIAIAAGATAVIQPGGSVRDRETIAAADRAGIAMVLTGMRHFRH